MGAWADSGGRSYMSYGGIAAYLQPNISVRSAHTGMCGTATAAFLRHLTGKDRFSATNTLLYLISTQTFVNILYF